MNDDAKSILIDAWMRGHRQVAQLHSAWDVEGECAVGLLHLARHTSRAEALACRDSTAEVFGKCIRDTEAHFGIGVREGQEIRRRNDRGENFLTIARKVGVVNEVA